MNQILNRKKRLKYRILPCIFSVLLLFSFQNKLYAQLTFNTPVAGDPITGSELPAVLLAKPGLGASYYKVPNRSLISLSADGNGNLAFSDSLSKICRLDGDRVIAFNSGGGTTAMAIDPTNSFLYAAVTPALSNYTVGTFPSATQMTIPTQSSANLIGAFVKGPGIATGLGIANTFVIVQSGANYTDLITSKAISGGVAGNYDIRKSVIKRFIWSDNGSNTSVGYFVGKSVNTSTSSVLSIPLVASGDLVYLNGSSTRSSLYFASIGGMAFDPCGHLYFSDVENNVVRKIAIEQVTGTAAAGTNQLTLAATPAATVQIGNLVSGLNIPASTYITAISGSVLTLSANTNGAVSSSSGLVIVTGVTDVAGTFGIFGNSGNGALAGNAVFNGPSAIAFDPSGNLFIQDRNNKSVRKVNIPAGTAAVITAFNTSGVTLSKNVSGISCDASGNVFVAENGSLLQKILKINTSGLCTAVAGSGPLLVYYCNSTVGSPVLTSAAGFGRIVPGMYMRGGGIPLGTRVLSVTSASSITLTANSTASVSIATSFSSRDSLNKPIDSTYLDGPRGIVVNATGDQITYLENSMNLVRRIDLNAMPMALSAPVPISSYTVQLQREGTVLLKWAAASSADQPYFSIERSQDGVHFNRFARVSAKGIGQANYDITDDKPEKGFNYYRLSQVEKTGVAQPIDVKSVKVTVAPTVTLYPNPSDGSKFSISFSSDDTIDPISGLEVSVTDMFGQPVLSKILAKTGDGVYVVDTGRKLGTGIYLVRINNQITRKLIVQ